MRKRIDRLVMERGLAESREKAQALIMAGLVLVDERPVLKAGTSVSETCQIRLKAPGSPYVSRGGLKLEGALRSFSLDVAGKTCVDIGSSTGGFTHCLLLRDAARVYAVDVDTGQLDWRLRQDSRVIPRELNARLLEPADIGESVDLVTIDASFISLTLLLPRTPPVLKSGGLCIALVKPQFEAGRELVGAGGIVSDPEVHKAVLDKCQRAGVEAGLKVVNVAESPITGKQGNREFFILFEKP